MIIQGAKDLGGPPMLREPLRPCGAKRASRLLAAILAIAALQLAASGANAQRSGGFDHEGLAKQMLEAHIRPGYETFAGAAMALKSSLEAGCKQRDPKSGDAAKAAFRDTVLAWSRVEHLRFGPAIDGNRFERVVFWPDRQKIGERQVAQILTKKDEAALVVADLHAKSVAVQGLTALEVMLYAKSTGDILADTPEAKFACGYATAIAGNLAAIARDIAAEWADGGRFAEIWLKPGEQNPLYKDSNGPTFQLLNAYKFGINNPREGKLLPSLGLKRTGVGGPFAPKSRPPFELSCLSIPSMVANTEGVLHLYEKGGFAERLAVNEPQSDKLIKSELANVIKGMREMEPGCTTAFNDKAAMDKLALVREPFVSALLAGGEALATESGMVLGFTDDDGD